MYDIRQFKPALYVLVLLGMCGFAVAAESGTIFSLSVLALAINAYLVYRGWFRPMPRVLANLVTICVAIYKLHEAMASGGTPVLQIGEFLMLLQIVKLWEQRGNRDYGQLLILSLLLMVAAAISTSSFLFGLILIGYLFLSLYCCLLFHLKVETDAAIAAISAPPRAVSPAMVRQDQRFLSRSMRKLTMVVSTVSLVFAVAVFLFFPRGAGEGMLGPAQFTATQALVGFSDEVRFQDIAQIQQNDTPVAYVWLKHNDTPVRGGLTLLLRGVTVDTYLGKAGGGRWVRWPRKRMDDSRDYTLNRSVTEPAEKDASAVTHEEVPPDHFSPLGPTTQPSDVWTQRVTLKPAGTNVLFAMAGAYSFRPDGHSMEFRYSARDGELRNLSMRAGERQPDGTTYEVRSTNVLGNFPPPSESGTAPQTIDEDIQRIARLAEVSGRDAAGSFAAQRAQHVHPDNEPDELDGKIAANIERYLRANYSYTLDLTDTKRLNNRDPLAEFLAPSDPSGADAANGKKGKGHCEYFAGAMTLMCQSLGMKARMCLGFRCDEFNSTPGADNYIVRQSHAHAWVEVYTPDGWKTFDPTASSDADEQARRAGLLQTLRHVWDYLQYAYGNAVITYSNENRSSLIQSTESAMLHVSSRSSMRMDLMRHWRLDQMFESKSFLTFFSGALIVVMALMALTALFFIARYAWDIARLRRRATRIGIDALPTDEQLRLARQLEFYDDLVRLLDRHRIIRRPGQTPLEFSRSLLFLTAEEYEAIRRLTELFYRVRYGRVELTPARQRHLATAVLKLERELKWRE